MLTTPRLVLLPLYKSMISARLNGEDFTLDCDLPDGRARVHFGPEWPGEVLPLFPMLLRSLGDEDQVEYSYTIIDRATGEAVGQMGAKGDVDSEGQIEIGYGMNKSLGVEVFATEAVGALREHLLNSGGITQVTAETAVGNVASQRVLEKNGFVRVGTSWTEDDGDVVLWSTTAG